MLQHSMLSPEVPEAVASQGNTINLNQRLKLRVWCSCSQCESVCRSRGGTPAGNTYNNFECRVQESPSGVCVRVSKSGETWQEATGTLPERTEGARGAGVMPPLMAN